MFNLEIHHLEFIVRALTPIEMGEYKGSALRGAWQAYLQQAYCTAPSQARAGALHQATCPVCYLTGREEGSESRRPYALQPPLSRQARYEPGEHFRFGFSLFGAAQELFPYILLAVSEMGEEGGIGRRIGLNGQRGRFELLQVRATQPLTGAVQDVLPEGSRAVRRPALPVRQAEIGQAVDGFCAGLAEPGRAVRLEFLTPLRIIEQERLVHRFAFRPFFQRLLERLYALDDEHAPEVSADRLRLTAQAAALLPLAEQVEVLADCTNWWDVHGFSGRLGRSQPLGGLVGEVYLQSEHWPALLPVLLWGQSAQVGKNVVKGGGWYRCQVSQGRGWDDR